MGRYGEQLWAPNSAAPLRGRRMGVYRPYCPDPLAGSPSSLHDDLIARATAVEAGIRSLTGTVMVSLDRLAGFLLRSEAVASSRIAGIGVPPQQVALAEFASGAGTDSVVEGFSVNARRVARNIAALRHAVTDLAEPGAITVDGIVNLQRTLLPGHRHTGTRSVQTWLGGSEWNPLDAAFIPAPPSEVVSLMTDLAAYASGDAHPPLIQAGLVHAQFETIQPFDDGNGRVARMLIHAVLARRGLVTPAVLPVSLAFVSRSDRYVTALAAYCHDGPPGGRASHAALNQWLTFFLDSMVVAIEEARTFADEIAELRRSWDTRLAACREQTVVVRNRPREPSTADRLITMLPGSPVLTAASAARILDVSVQAAWAAAEELVGAGILRRRQIGRGATGYLSREVSDLLTLAERRLAAVKRA
ncbi:Fic family protein [Frankia sp. Cas3]|uniref:Fic family protein n=1 Tax=Frankia sp. Cas3 TaxID=3073926 RepID=UPI002AD4B9E9|nr:Fic family protein [Frankia sp. Cas3]